ncbi:hypothetical protein [Rugosimonospora acidiphila]
MSIAGHVSLQIAAVDTTNWEWTSRPSPLVTATITELALMI